MTACIIVVTLTHKSCVDINVALEFYLIISLAQIILQLLNDSYKIHKHINLPLINTKKLKKYSVRIVSLTYMNMM